MLRVQRNLFNEVQRLKQAAPMATSGSSNPSQQQPVFRSQVTANLVTPTHTKHSDSFRATAF